MKYCTWDVNGIITARYDEKIHGVFGSDDSLIPSTAIPITEEEFAQSMTGGLVVIDGAVTDIGPPPTPYHELIDGKWVPDINRLKAANITELSIACGAACEAGHTSNAVGTNHFYTTDGSYSQVNLIGHHLDAMANAADLDWTQEITCVPEGDTTSTRVAHTAAQTLAVTVPVKQMIEGNRTIYNDKKHYVLNLDPASPTIEEDIAAVTWESVEPQ